MARKRPVGRRRRAATKPAESTPTALERWKARVARAIALRTGWQQTYDVEKGERYFLGDHEARSLRLNRFGALAETLLPDLYVSAPKFFVRPKPGRTAPAAARVAALGEGVLAAIADQDDHLETAGELAVTQALFRVGVLKITYDPRLELNPKAGAPLVQSTDAGEPVLDPTGQPVSLRDPLTGDAMTEPSEVLTDELYRWAWVDAANLLLPDDGPDPAKWTWIGEEVLVPLATAKADARFPAALRDQLRGNYTRKAREGDGARRSWIGPTSLDEMIRYVECYDLQTKRWVVWADGQDFEDFLVDEPVPPWIDNDPYAVLRLGKPILGPEPLPWPCPVVRDWIPIQDEWNIRRKQVMEGAKRSARKIYYDDSTFPDGDEALKSLQSPDDMTAVKVTDLSRPPVAHQDPDLNPSIYRDIPLLELDWQLITGQTGARMAKPDAGSATEATFTEHAASLRSTRRQRAVTRWLSVAGRKMLQCVKETLTLDFYVLLRQQSDAEFTEYVESVYGIPVAQQALIVKFLPGVREAFRERFGTQKVYAITREDLQFEADVSIEPGSTRPKNLEGERAAFLNFLRILGQAPQLALSRELLTRVLRMFELEDPRLADELTALAERMVSIQGMVAGRGQAGANGQGGEAGQPGGPNTGSILQALLSGGNGGA